MNNSRGPLNSSGNWWSIIKAYEDLQDESYEAAYTVVEEIINSIGNEEISELLTEMLDIWDGDNLKVHATGGLASGGTQPAGYAQENRLTPEQKTRMDELEERVKGRTITRVDNEEYERLVSLAGFALQKPQPTELITFSVRTPDSVYETKPTMVYFGKEGDEKFSNTTIAQFIKDLNEVIENA
jgi:hypothetical protein